MFFIALFVCIYFPGVFYRLYACQTGNALCSERKFTCPVMLLPQLIKRLTPVGFEHFQCQLLETDTA